MAKDNKNWLARLFTRNSTKGILEEVTTPTINQLNKSSAVKAVSTSSIELIGSVDALSANENQLMTLYDQMDQDAIVSASLDLYADNATLINQKTGHVAAVESGDTQFQDEINDFLWNVYDVDTEAWEVARNIAKYGKVFLDTDTKASKGEWSFTQVEDPSRVQALVSGNNKVQWYAVLPEQQAATNSPASFYAAMQNKTMGQYEVVPGDRFIAGFNSRVNAGKMTLQVEDIYDRTAEEVLTIRTGRSILAPVIAAWQTLNTLEQALLTNRLTKATQFKIVEIDVSDTTNTEAKEILENVKNAFKNSETIDQVQQRYQNRLAPVTIDDLVFSLKRGEKGAVNIKPVGGEMSEVPMNDVNHFRNKFFSGLAMPKAYLGFEETTPGGLGEGVLTKIDERLGRRIIRLQQVLKHVLKQLIEYYWTHSKLGRTSANMPEYELILGQVSTKQQEDARENLLANYEVATNILQLVDNPRFEDKIDDDKLFRYIFGEVMQMDLGKIDRQLKPEDVSLKVKDITPRSLTETKARGKIVSPAGKLIEQYIVTGKFQHLIENATLSELLEDHEIFLEDTNKTQVNLRDVLKYPRFRRVLSEATYKELKDKSKSKDPLRLSKSKKLVMKYTGLDDENFITFTVTAEDPAKNAKEGKPTSYKTRVALKDALGLIKGSDNLTDLQLMQKAMQGNIAVSCTCPAAKYWGQQYNGTKEGYSIDLNTIAPTKRLPTQVLCKHTLGTVTVLPFWTNTIVRDMRAKGLLASSKNKKTKLEKESLENMEDQ